MNRLFARLAAAALAATLTAVLPATPAHAAEKITIPGCYGVQPTVVCDVTLTYSAPVSFVEYGDDVTVPVPTTNPTLCVSWTDRDGVKTEHCESVGTVPPLPTFLGEWVDDTLDWVLFELWHGFGSSLCAALGNSAPGIPGVVDINSEGDVWVDGSPQLDCPPYNMDWDGDGQPG